MHIFTQKQVKAFAPATIANVSVGFDILGLAISQPGDTVTARIVEGNSVRMKSVSGDAGLLPTMATKNTAGIAAQATLEKAGVQTGLELELTKGLPIGSGLGSSAASAAAAAFAVNRLLGSPLRKKELIEPCLKAEEAVSGRHADNVAPSLLGGLIMVRSLEPLDIIRLPLPEKLHAAVVTPAIEVPTKKAREILPKTVSLAAMIQANANIATFVSACYAGDLSLMARCTPDEIVTPARVKLIPGSHQVIETAYEHGALMSSISGAGPSLFALCHSAANAQRVAKAMQVAFAHCKLESSAVVSPANCPGAREL
jgi:homoserine kinase